MAFKAPPQQPDFADLIVSLDNSKLQLTNNALYQTIFLLIQRITRSRDLLLNQLEEGDELLSNRTFLTAADEVAFLPFSRELLAGKAVTFDDSVANERTVNADLPVGTVFSTWINANPSILLGYGTWSLFATGTGLPGNLMDITVA